MQAAKCYLRDQCIKDVTSQMFVCLIVWSGAKQSRSPGANNSGMDHLPVGVNGLASLAGKEPNVWSRSKYVTRSPQVTVVSSPGTATFSWRKIVSQWINAESPIVCSESGKWMSLKELNWENVWSPIRWSPSGSETEVILVTAQPPSKNNLWKRPYPMYGTPLNTSRWYSPSLICVTTSRPRRYTTVGSSTRWLTV